MQNAGELNFMITILIDDYLTNREKVNYQAFNDVLGALSAAGHELYDRKIRQYEDIKCQKNGEVFSNYQVK